MTDQPSAPEDLLVSNHWRPLRRILESLDQEIAALYEEASITGVRTRFVGPLIALGRQGPMTIQELATSQAVTHSAMSQTASAMRNRGLVTPAAHHDGRSRRIQLSERGRELLPFLQAEWRATEAAVRELDAELPYPLHRIAGDLAAALAARPFRDRLRAHLELPGRSRSAPAG